LCQGTNLFDRIRFGLLRCRDCGLVVTPDFWRPRIGELMEEEWFGESWNAVPSFWSRWFEAMGNRRTFNRIRRAQTGGTMLDIGFGSGSFLAYMHARGWTVHGCDASPSACEQAARRWGIPTDCGDVDSLPEEARYDLVVTNHVLEHVQEPQRMLEAIRRRMKPGGQLHIAVPNVACWEARLTGWTGYQPYHLTYFSRETLSRIVNDAGFRVDTVTTHEQFAGWFLAILGTVVPGCSGAARREKRAEMHARPGTSPLEHTYRAAMALSGGVTWPLRRLQEYCGRGDEVVVLARKPG